jgi:hypothetical protein
VDESPLRAGQRGLDREGIAVRGLWRSGAGVVLVLGAFTDLCAVVARLRHPGGCQFPAGQNQVRGCQQQRAVPVGGGGVQGVMLPPTGDER